VTFRANSHARPDASGRLRLMPGDELLDAERIVALPTIEGPQVSGVSGAGIEPQPFRPSCAGAC
jgi:hypothetical protein